MRVVDEETFTFMLQCINALLQDAQQKSEALQAVYNDLLATPTLNEFAKRFSAQLPPNNAPL